MQAIDKDYLKHIHFYLEFLPKSLENLVKRKELVDIIDLGCGDGAILFGSVGRSDLPKRTAELALLEMRKRYEVVNNRPFIIDPILAHNSILFRDPVEVPGFEVISPEESLYNGKSGGDVDSSYHWTRKQFTREKVEKTVRDAFDNAMDTDRQILCAEAIRSRE